MSTSISQGLPSKVSIYIDATHFGTEKPTGVEYYVDHLLPLLSEELGREGVEVAWVGHTVVAPPGKPETVRWIHSPHTHFWSQFSLSNLLKQERPTLFFTPSGVPPLLSGVPSAFTAHDLSVYVAPHAYTVMQRIRLREVSERAAHATKKILVPSHFVARQIHQFWRVPDERVATIPLGYIPSEVVSEPIQGIGNAPFFLFVSRLEEKKNLVPVIKGFDQLVTKEGMQAQLVLAGKPGYGFSQIEKTIAACAPETQKLIVMPGYVSDGQKRWLYEHAAAGIVSCPIEGFGLPVLDCFAAGIPAVCAQAGSVVEVGADAAVYVQSDIATDWYLQMRAALTEKDRMADLVAKGKRYVKEYTWERTAQATAAALLSALR